MEILDGKEELASGPTHLQTECSIKIVSAFSKRLSQKLLLPALQVSHPSRFAHGNYSQDEFSIYAFVLKIIPCYVSILKSSLALFYH
jgi:hypothetical protein